MNATEIVRAWKDHTYREGLPEAVRRQLPPSPAGVRRLDEMSAEGAHGAGPTNGILTMGCCDGFTEAEGFCSWFCGSNGLDDVTYGCCTPNRDF
jgi:mersacidin/lichenicidin family type 2 lantibiotic